MDTRSRRDRASGIGAVVLAAGSARRFGAPKQLALLEGRPLLQHVLDTLWALAPIVTIVVVPPAPALDAVTWRDEQRIVNPDPARGLSSSLQLGVGAAAGHPDLVGVVVVLADQPRTSAEVIRRLMAAIPAALDAGAWAIVPSYAQGGGSNPVLLLHPGFPLVHQTSGDTGLSHALSLVAGRVYRVAVPGANPDVDTQDELRALAAGGPSAAGSA